MRCHGEQAAYDQDARPASGHGGESRKGPSGSQINPPRLGPLLDHMIRPLQERRRDRQAEGFGGLEVDDQLELGGLLNGQVAGLGALEDLVNIDGEPSVRVTLTRAVAHQSTSVGILAPAEYRRQSLRDTKGGKVETVGHRRTLGKDDHRVRLCPSDRLKRLAKLWACSKGRLGKSDVDEVDSERLSGCFGGTQFGFLPRMIGIRQRSERAQAREGLLEELHALACDFEGQERNPGKVAAGPRQALYKACLHRIAADRKEDRNVLECPSGPDRRETGDDHGDVGLCQLRGPYAQRLKAALRVSNLEGDGLAFNVAEPSESFAKCLQEWIGLRSGGQPADARRLARRLRLGGEGHGEEAAPDHCNKRSPVHYSITWIRPLQQQIVRPSDELDVD